MLAEARALFSELGPIIRGARQLGYLDCLADQEAGARVREARGSFKVIPGGAA